MEETNKYGKYRCPCCGYFTMNIKPDNTFQDCPVCYWEDDGVQLDQPDLAGGANTMSLNEARKNFMKFGACDKRFITDVRPPREDEM